jgi:hypothetical protein
MEVGGHVVYNDWENGPIELARRMRDLGAGDRLLSRQFHYMPFPERPNWDVLEDQWDEWPNALGVWDSIRGVMQIMGLDENQAADCAQFLVPLVRFALMRDIPQIIIDHVRKDATERSGYGRGSGDKLAAVQASWFVEKLRPFSELEQGEIQLVRWKARSGYLPPRHRFAVGDGRGNLTFEAMAVGTTPEMKLDREIVDFLKSRFVEGSGSGGGDGGDGVAKSTVEKGVRGRGVLVRKALDRMAADDLAPVASVRGPGGGGVRERFVYVPELDFEGSSFVVEKGRVEA